MGNTIRGYHAYMDPDAYPKTNMPSVFDPLYGFPNGRKKREMLVTDEEMDRWGLDMRHRDYCAHVMVKLKKCQFENRGLASWYCGDIMHSYEVCQKADQILRAKEYERERRLLAKERRLKQQEQGGGEDKEKKLK